MSHAYAPRSIAAFAVLSSVTLGGCFLGYDSRWGQAKKSQEHTAESMRPATLSAAGGGAAVTAAKPLKARVWANAAYVSQTLDWQHEMRGIIDDANVVLAGGAGIRIEIAGVERWDDDATEDKLETHLHALAAHDKGDDAAWVIGLIGGLPKATANYHELGLTTWYGHHLVVRSARDVTEQDAIEKGLSELSSDARVELVRQRRRHRSTAVLLHEIGHTLGLIHQTGKNQLMLPAYSPKVDGFGDAALVLLKKSAAHRLAAEEGRPTYLDALAFYRAVPAGSDWVESERADMITRLAAYEPTGAPTPPPVAKVKAPEALNAEHAAVWLKSHEAAASGDAKGAWDQAKPLWNSYPDDYDVQDYRCTLAMSLSTNIDDIRSACADLKRITTGKSKKK